jgi:hypothetical protein
MFSWIDNIQTLYLRIGSGVLYHYATTATLQVFISQSKMHKTCD